MGPRKANLYAWLVGKDSRPLVLHNHIDVSAVDPKEWFSPPFEARIQLPWIYGRGVFDMKSVAIAQMLAMIDLKKSGVPLSHSVLFLATSSEERGSRLGVRRIIQLHPEMVRNFWAVLTEGGVVEARARDEIKFWGTEFAQKRYADLIVCGDDRQRLEDLRKTLKEIGPTVTDLRLTPEARAVFAAYGPTRDRKDLREMMTNLEDAMGDVKAFRKLPNYIQSMLRDEAVPFKVKEAPGGGWRAADQVPAPAGGGSGGGAGEAGAALADLRPDHDDRRAADRPRRQPARPSGLPGRSRRRCATPTPTRRSGPISSPGRRPTPASSATLGVPAYGFSPFLIMNTDTLQVDQANERFALPALRRRRGALHASWSAGWSLTLSASARCQILS